MSDTKKLESKLLNTGRVEIQHPNGHNFTILLKDFKKPENILGELSKYAKGEINVLELKWEGNNPYDNTIYSTCLTFKRPSNLYPGHPDFFTEKGITATLEHDKEKKSRKPLSWEIYSGYK